MSQAPHAIHRSLAYLQDAIDQIGAEQEPDVLELIARLGEALKASGHTRDIVILQASDSLTTTQVSALIGVSLPTLRRMVDRGEIRGHKVGRHLRFLARDVDTYQKARRERERALDELCALSVELEALEDSGAGS